MNNPLKINLSSILILKTIKKKHTEEFLLVEGPKKSNRDQPHKVVEISEKTEEWKVCELLLISTLIIVEFPIIK